MGAQSNRFDFVRLSLASLVFLYHAVVLSSGPAGGRFEAELAVVAELAIQGFFIVSGLLVFGSLERSSSLTDYAGKRVRRLYPAYLVVILIPALVSLILAFGDLAAMGDVLRYLGANAIFLNFLEPDLPGLFEGQRFTAVNGALWTLKIEVMFYLALPVLAWGLGRLKSLWWAGLAALVLIAKNLVNAISAAISGGEQLIGSVLPILLLGLSVSINLDEPPGPGGSMGRG